MTAVEGVRYVSPIYGDDTRFSGYQFVCPACGWTSPVMKHRLGAERHKREHACVVGVKSR